jgi:nucleoside-diphosphate-sugar epimerase
MSIFKDKTLLITGAAGFIGSNLVKRLFHDVKYIKVIGIDSITDYYDVNIKYERLKEIEEIINNLRISEP